jgi:hypothetical protein
MGDARCRRPSGWRPTAEPKSAQWTVAGPRLSRSRLSSPPHALSSLFPPLPSSQPTTSSPFAATGSPSRIQPSPRWPRGVVPLVARVGRAAATPTAHGPPGAVPPVAGAMAARRCCNSCASGGRGPWPRAATTADARVAVGPRPPSPPPSPGCCAPGSLGGRGPWSRRRSRGAGLRLTPSSWGLVAGRRSLA